MMPKRSTPPKTSDEAAYIRQLLRRKDDLEQKEYRKELAELIRSIVLSEKGTERAGAYIIDTGLAVVDFNSIETAPRLPGYSTLAQAFFVIYHEWLHHEDPRLTEAEIDVMQQPEPVHAALLGALREFEKNSGIRSLAEARKT